MESTLRAAAGAPDLKLPSLKLIETLAWDGTGFVRLDLHLARLARSVDVLGWRGGDARTALWTNVPKHPARCRLTLDHGGQFAVTFTDMPTMPTVWRLGLAHQRLQSTDPWLTVKSTNRAAYDAARAALPIGLDEVIFQNECGEVCDGSITTLFYDRGDGLRTPPLQCGLLPGVLRAQMALPEAVLMAEDLPKVQLWVGNSLRGLIPAVWAV